MYWQYDMICSSSSGGARERESAYTRRAGLGNHFAVCEIKCLLRRDRPEIAVMLENGAILR